MLGDDLNFLFGEFVPRCTHRVDKTFDDYQTLQYMAGGAVDLSIADRHYALEGHYFWSCYPGPRISFHVQPNRKSWVHRYIAFHGPLVARWVAEGLFPIAPPQTAPVDGMDYDARFDRMLGLSGSTDRVSQLRAIHELEGILIDLADVRARTAVHQPWLKTVLTRLGEYSAGAQEPEYQALAYELGMTASTLRRRFKEAAGTTPHQYVLQSRIAEAKRRLGATDEPIKSIAKRLGYRDVYFFSRQFRAITGVPPALYRRSRGG
jgi:AraC-like DNA-binding protein